MADRLKAKVALITGAGSVGPGWGNGKAMAVLFAREGALVFGIDIEDIEDLFRLNIPFIDTGGASIVKLEAATVEVVFQSEELVIVFLTQFVVSKAILSETNTVEVVDVVSGEVLVSLVACIGRSSNRNSTKNQWRSQDRCDTSKSCASHL